MKAKPVVAGLCLLLMTTLVGAGCGAGGGNAPSGKASGGQRASQGQVIKTIKVKETEFKLNPSNITLGKSGTYVFKADNVGNFTHALEIEGNGVEKETEDLNPGHSAELKVNLKPGTYEIYCPVDSHKERGMEGKVTVGGSASKSSSGGSGGHSKGGSGGGGY